LKEAWAATFDTVLSTAFGIALCASGAPAAATVWILLGARFEAAWEAAAENISRTVFGNALCTSAAGIGATVGSAFDPN
jgi:hypothetical protein